MTKSLKAGDCLCQEWAQVDAYQRYRDIIQSSNEPNLAKVFAVFSEEKKFLGLVEDRQAALFPGRIFADLLIRRQPSVLSPDTDLATVLQRLGEERCDYLPIAKPDGNIYGVISQVSIFSILTQRERALNADRDRLIGELQSELENRKIAASVFDATSEGIMVTDAHLCIIMINQSFARTTGYPEDEVIGQSPQLLKSGRHDSGFYQEMWRALSEQGSWEGEIWNRRKNGEIYPEWLHINAIRDDKGTVRYYAGVFSDITQHQDLRAKLLHLAYYDVLTNLPNRQLFLDRLNHTVTQSNRTGDRFSILFIDLDRFKDINDTLGHSFGDKFLTAVGNRLRNAMRESDTVARIGGDEFTVILQNTYELADISAAAEKLLAALVSSPLNIDGRELFIAASIGVSRYPDDGDDAEALLINADAAMFRAKEQGKGRVRFFSPEMHSRFAERLEIGNALRQALAVDALWLAWQAQVSLPDGHIVGAEVLARWDGVDGLAIAPSVFIPIAEEIGLISVIGDWALRSMCSLGSELSHKDKANFRIAVNFSPLQLKSGGHQSIMETLTAAGFDPCSLEIEITESALSPKYENMPEFLKTLGENGIEVAIDDFGTGYSNLANLKNLQIQKLKIDRSFVSNLSASTNDQQIVSAIISMAHTLGLKVLAEGVETLEQAKILSELGCDMAQGFYFSRPITFDAFKQLISQKMALPVG